MKKSVIYVLLEMILVGVFIYSSGMEEHRAVMFDANQRQLYEMISAHTITAAVALPLFGVGFFWLSKSKKYANSRQGVRVMVSSFLAITIYCIVWLVLNWSERPPSPFVNS